MCIYKPLNDILTPHLKKIRIAFYIICIVFCFFHLGAYLGKLPLGVYKEHPHSILQLQSFPSRDGVIVYEAGPVMVTILMTFNVLLFPTLMLQITL